MFNKQYEAELDSAQHALDVAMRKANDEWLKVAARGGTSFQITDELGDALEKEAEAMKKRDKIRKKTTRPIIRGEGPVE